MSIEQIQHDITTNKKLYKIAGSNTREIDMEVLETISIIMEGRKEGLLFLEMRWIIKKSFQKNYLSKLLF